jgi:hypothetical protein
MRFFLFFLFFLFFQSSFSAWSQFMVFQPEKNGLQFSKPSFSYSVSPEEELNISGVSFNDRTFKVGFGPLKSFGTLTGSKMDLKNIVLLVSVPHAVGKKGALKIISKDGTILFEENLKAEHFDSANDFIKKLPADYWGDTQSTDFNHVLFQNDQLAGLTQQKHLEFKFCWLQSEAEFYSHFCTPHYRFQKKESLAKIRTELVHSKVYLEPPLVNVELNSGTFEIDPGKTLKFFATGTRAYTIEFNVQVPTLNLLDFYSDIEKKKINLRGHSNVPLMRDSQILPAVAPESLTSFFMWQPTIGDNRDYWQVEMPVDRNELLIQGLGGGVFIYQLKFAQIPTKDFRVRLSPELKSTYSARPKLKVNLQKKAQIVSKGDGQIDLIPNTETAAIWEFAAPEKGTVQEGLIVVKTEDGEFVASHSLYRGYSRELSLRAAGVLSADLQLNLLGELAYNQWFESLFGWEDDLFSYQRWGLSFRHLSPFKTFTPKGSTAKPLSLKLTTFDLKYRFTPGLWDLDETWGLIFGAEDIALNEAKGSFGGGGFFWARSMPEIFDRIMNWFPFMSYPKWVDMEMLYYFLPMNSATKRGPESTYAVNFHGKILWSKTFFGEAGFGIKAYSYKVKKQTIGVSALYGTVGLGLNF